MNVVDMSKGGTEELIAHLGNLYKSHLKGVLLRLFDRYMHENITASDFFEIAAEQGIDLAELWLGHVAEKEDDDEDYE